MFQPHQILSDRYQLQQALGHTALGRQTWLGIDLNSQEQVIIKLLAFSPQMQWQELKLFEREAETLQSLQHPRIPRYRDYFDLDKNLGEGVCWFVLVQDYIPGNSLQDLLDKNKHFLEQEIRTVAQEILEILIYLHELNPPVLHRDIKPSNLILGQDNHIYLIDFGAVQGQANVTGMTFTVVGTSGYAPLEQFWGRAVPASDIYALGATLIHLLTGVSPIDLPQENSQIKFADRVTIKADLLQWLQKATQMAVENRFRTAREALGGLHSGKIQQFNRQGKKLLKNKLIKPVNSLIILTKTSHQMVINSPMNPQYPIKYGKIFFTLFSGLVVIGLLGFSLAIIWVVGCWITLIIKMMFSCFKNNQAVFTENSFEINYKILGFTFHRVQRHLDSIIGVFLYESKEKYKVKIRTKNTSYVIGEKLEEEEAAWLAQEIQDWLQ